MAIAMLWYFKEIQSIRNKATEVSNSRNTITSFELSEYDLIYPMCRIYLGKRIPYYAKIYGNDKEIVIYSNFENIILSISTSKIENAYIKRNPIAPLLSLIILEHISDSITSPVILEPYAGAFNRKKIYYLVNWLNGRYREASDLE